MTILLRKLAKILVLTRSEVFVRGDIVQQIAEYILNKPNEISIKWRCPYRTEIAIELGLKLKQLKNKYNIALTVKDVVNSLPDNPITPIPNDLYIQNADYIDDIRELLKIHPEYTQCVENVKNNKQLASPILLQLNSEEFILLVGKCSLDIARAMDLSISAIILRS